MPSCIVSVSHDSNQQQGREAGEVERINIQTSNVAIPLFKKRCYTMGSLTTAGIGITASVSFSYKWDASRRLQLHIWSLQKAWCAQIFMLNHAQNFIVWSKVCARILNASLWKQLFKVGKKPGPRFIMRLLQGTALFLWLRVLWLKM